MHTEKMSKWDKNNFPLRVVLTNMMDKVPIHTHDFIEIVIFAKGNAVHTIHNGDKKLRYSVMQGDCFTIMPNETHSFEDGNFASYYNIIFSPELIAEELKNLKEFSTWNMIFGMKDFDERSKFHLSLNDRSQIDFYIKRLFAELDKKPQGYKICARSILLEILLVILRCSPKKMLISQTSTKSNPDIMSVINEMEKNPEKHYTLSDLARKANMCVSGFTKKFRNMLGVSPMEYLLGLRIEKSEQLLTGTSMTIYNIAETCGFYDINYFIKVFRRHRGITPAKFRKGN